MAFSRSMISRNSPCRSSRSGICTHTIRAFPSAFAIMAAIVSRPFVRKILSFIILTNLSTLWCSFCSRPRATPMSSPSSRPFTEPRQTVPIVKALVEAAEAGKSVTALVELKARFDEEANIRWARDLERAGVQVVYGFIELKTHAKLSLVVRREGGRACNLCPCRHRQLSSGHRARLYRSVVFHGRHRHWPRCRTHFQLTLPDTPSRPNSSAWQSRRSISRKQFWITSRRRSRTRKAGRPAAIWMKMNALVDPGIIDALYDASAAGVASRSCRSRHLLSTARRPRPVREHSRQIDRRPIPRTRTHLLFRRRPPAAASKSCDLYFVRRHDATQPRSSG